METQNEYTDDGNSCNGSQVKEAMNEECITAKVRQTLGEWNKREKARHLNRFRSPGTNASSRKLVPKADQ